MNTKDALKTQEVIVTVHTFNQCSGTVYYVVSPGKAGVECRDDYSLDMEIESRVEALQNQGYRVGYKYLTTTVE